MRVVRYTDAGAFAERTQPLLMAAEAENNLLLGIAAAARAAPTASPAPYLATVESHDRPVAVAIMWPPRNLVLSSAPREALVAIGADLVESGLSVPGAIGRVDVADAFSAVWHESTGDEVRRAHDMRIYELTSVVAPRPVTGRLRQAAASDRALVEAWAYRFVADTGVSDEAADVVRNALRAIDEGRLYLWDDGEPVTMAAWTGPTPNGVRVTLVYTPPPLRGRGYASACVAGLSASVLAAGRKRCFLFTDLANPTSNHIYMAIGYRPVCDCREYRFERDRMGRS